MDITKIIARVPDGLKLQIIDFRDGKYKGEDAILVMFLQEFSDREIEELKKRKGIRSAGNAHYKIAPEIRRGYIIL